MPQMRIFRYCHLASIASWALAQDTTTVTTTGAPTITVTCNSDWSEAETACCTAINDVETTGGYSTVMGQSTAEAIRAGVCDAGDLKTTLDTAKAACSAQADSADQGTVLAQSYSMLVAAMGICDATPVPTPSTPAPTRDCALPKNCVARTVDATCDNQAYGYWAYDSCDTCHCSDERCFDLQSLDKSFVDKNCDCQTLKQKLSDIFAAMQRETCSIARHDDDVKLAEAMSQADRDIFWEKSLLGCIGPKPNGFLVSPIKASGVGTEAAPGACHPNVHIQDVTGGGNTIANCRRENHLTVEYLFKSLVEASAAWSPDTQTAELDLTTEFADGLPASGARTCNTDTQIEAVSAGTLASHTNTAMMIHGTMYKRAGTSIKSMSLAGLTGEVSHGTVNYWDEEKEFLSDARHKKVAAGQSKLTVGITSFPWSSGATDESRGCFAKELNAVDEMGAKDTGDAAATTALSWFDETSLTLYMPLSTAADKQQDYTDCKSSKGSNVEACDRCYYLKSAYSKYVMVNPTGSQETLVDAEYTFHQANGTNTMYICATKANMGTHEFVFDPKSEMGTGLSVTASIVEEPTPSPTPVPTPLATPVPTTNVATPAATPEPTTDSAATPAATPEPTAASAGTPAATPEPTAASADTPAATPEPTEASGATAAATPEPTEASAGTPAATPEPTEASGATPAATPEPTVASAATPAATPEPTAQSTPAPAADSTPVPTVVTEQTAPPSAAPTVPPTLPTPAPATPAPSDDPNLDPGTVSFGERRTTVSCVGIAVGVVATVFV